MLKIKDLVTIDEQAEFRSDVQVSDYGEPTRNLALLRSYLFTFSALQGQESAVGILKITTEAFSNTRLENRIVVIANYGHGKSHLALVMANYFGKPYASEEVKTVLHKISNVVDTPAQASHFREFRQNRPEFLVIRLRGDVPRSLREQFVAALEQALKECNATRETRLQSWYQDAETFLTGLTGNDLANANQFLESYSTEVSALLQDVRDRRDDAYNTCRILSAHLHGMPFDFGSQVSIRELINWAGRTYCGEGKPLGGIFVLFDEFSLYVQSYAERNAAGELQDLLNGVEDQKGIAVFLAFAQHDPLTWARNVAKTAQGLESLEKELTRIPKKISLYSLMESVIDAYLDQPEDTWQTLRSTPRTLGPLARASNLTMDLFRKRYEETLRWNTEKFDKTVTKGCFPLHPLTTALLCDLKLQAMKTAGNPRTVLGFVFEQIAINRDKQAVIDGSRLNWVLPVTLVEYFKDYLPGTAFLLYENAQRNLSSEDPAERRALLKALLLQEVAKLPLGPNNQGEFLAEAAGIDLEEARKHLRALSNANVIHYDQGMRIYSFWPIAANPYRLEQIFVERLGGQALSWELLKSLNKPLDSVAVEVKWGNSEDWQASQKILTREFFESKYLHEMISPFNLSATGEFQEVRRGLVIWLLAQAEVEVTWFRQNAPRILKEAYPAEYPPPLLIMLPTRPVSELIEAIKKKAILEHFSQDDRQEVTMQMYDHEMLHLEQTIGTGLTSLRGDALFYVSSPRDPNTWVVPSPYRPSLQAFGRSSLQQLLGGCYELAYRYSPPEFFGQYREKGTGQLKLREAVRIVSAALLRNGLSSNRLAIGTNPVARDLCQKFLVSKWHLITADFRICEPSDANILQAWKLLEVKCPAGAKDVSVRIPVVELFNPPYGYDSNTVTLLLCAWIGHYTHDLQISIQGRVATLDTFAELLTGGGRQFVQQLAAQNVQISRRDRGQVQREIQALIEKANREQFRQDEARDDIAKLQAFCDESASNPSLVSSAEQAAKNLGSALSLAEAYDKETEEISKTIRDERTVVTLINLHSRISGLPHLGCVLQTGPTPDQLRQDWLGQLTNMVDTECRELENVQRLMQVERNQESLQYLKRQLARAKLTDLAERVELSLEEIGKKVKKLETQQREASIQAELKAMNARADLATLFGFKERLQHIIDYSPETMQLRDEQLAAIGQEISRLASIANELVAAVDRLDSLAASDDWRQRYLRACERYQGTSYAQELDVADERVVFVNRKLGHLIIENKATWSLSTIN